MKKVIAFPISWGLFWFGDAVSHPMIRFDLGWIYPVYNWCMCKSGDVQDWAGLQGPWQAA